MNRAIRTAVGAVLLAVAFGAHASEPGLSTSSDTPVITREATSESLVPPADRRGAEQTLLTYPEWFLVFSPAEYARTVQSQPSHDFPFVAHIGELWSGYAAVTREQWRDGYAVNPGYHLMIGVLATSTTVEYGVRAIYGNTVGRISWALGGGRATDEDAFDAQTAQQYVDFIRQEPWYQFNFASRLKGLWTDVPMTGHGPIRKIERRFALTGEYGIKAAYAQVIKFATHTVYAPAQMTTDVVVQALPDGWSPPDGVRILRRFADGRALLSLPRYDEFKTAAKALVDQGVQIIDIAGNSSTILVSVWVPDDEVDAVDKKRVLFVQPIRTPARTSRVVMLVPVAQLGEVIGHAEKANWTLEHVFDY